MRIRLIEVPYVIGDDRHPASRGPERYVEAGAPELAGGAPVERVERPGPFRDHLTASVAVSRRLARAVRRAVAAGEVPLVLAGSCDACLGVVSGLDDRRTGIVWVDAHADFNTPESSVTGFFPGMSLAVITGDCHGELWGRVGGGAPIPQGRTLLVGTRDVDPAEQERLDRSPAQVVRWRDGEPESDVLAALDRLAAATRDVYLHVDNDAFDPEVAPGTVDPPVPGGLSLEAMEELVRAVTARFTVRAAALTTYDPDRDRDGRTLRAGLSVIRLLAESSG